MLKKKPAVTTPYLPQALEAIDKGDITKAHQFIQDGAIDYFNRLSDAAATIPVADAALLICLYHHIGNELARNDPVAAELAKKLKPIPLPPINYTRKK